MSSYDAARPRRDTAALQIRGIVQEVESSVERSEVEVRGILGRGDRLPIEVVNWYNQAVEQKILLQSVADLDLAESTETVLETAKWVVLTNQIGGEGLPALVSVKHWLVQSGWLPLF